MLGAVAQRIASRVLPLRKRVQGAADLADLQRRNALPQGSPAAFVLPMGLRGGARFAAHPLFVQDMEEVVGVLLVLRTYQRTGGEGRALVDLDQLIDAVVRAVTGWAPVGEPGVFVLRAGRMVSMATGTMAYQLDFALPRQLRHHPDEPDPVWAAWVPPPEPEAPEPETPEPEMED